MNKRITKDFNMNSEWKKKNIETFVNKKVLFYLNNLKILSKKN
jgi:hypothetical protein